MIGALYFGQGYLGQSFPATGVATVVVQANLFFRIWKLGTSTQQTVGSWS